MSERDEALAALQAAIAESSENRYEYPSADGVAEGLAERGYMLVRAASPAALAACSRCGIPIERDGQLCLATRQRTECRAASPAALDDYRELHRTAIAINAGGSADDWRAFRAALARLTEQEERHGYCDFCEWEGDRLADHPPHEAEAAQGAAPRAEGLVPALAYALARADLPTDMETSRDYAERLAPLVIESGWLSRPSDERVR